jgi:hypothetical protein
MALDHPVIVYDVELSQPERAANTPPYFHDSPLQILRYDLELIFRHAAEIPFIFLPLPRIDAVQHDVSIAGFFVQAAFFIISVVVTGVVCSAFSIGFPTPLLGAAILVVTVKAISRAQGPVRSQVDENYQDEAWLL